jgi:glutathione synthase/RimK-type ligase-like ATP-grasp enzyme
MRKSTTRYDLAILNDPKADNAPSDSKALKRFAAAAKKLDISAEFIEKEDYARLAEFDALFIRETTYVDHHTYRFARRALADGLVVIDDPDSIIKCTNKVYLAELLNRHRVPTPRTDIISRDTREAITATATFPCIIKQPDSSFSQGVFKVADLDELKKLLDRLLVDSELLIMQEFVPTEFDWRIGILDRKPLFACRYHMVKAHWQIAQTTATKTRYGNVEAVELNHVPPTVLKQATKAAGAIGDGLYGVDVKQFGRRAAVIEVNDNPNIDAGCEDGILGQELYERILQTFIDRIDKLRSGARGRR